MIESTSLFEQSRVIQFQSRVIQFQYFLLEVIYEKQSMETRVLVAQTV